MAASPTFETVDFNALTDADLAAWTTLRDSNPSLESPYHHPNYHACVDQHQGGCRVTLARREGVIVAILPWQGGVFARPSGAPLSDYQAIITTPETQIDIETLLKSQSVGAFHYTAMPTANEANGEDTCRMELDSVDTWRSERDGSYRRHLKSTRRRIRKATDDIGQPRIVTQSRDVDAYQALMRWKAQKFQDTRKFDVLANDGTAGMLRDLWERGPNAPLRADMHVLYFGDRIAACDLGLTDGHVFHSWIVGYDPNLLTYAPGIQLLESLIDAAPDIGYRVIDLGAGTDGYKRQYATHSRYITSGVVTLPTAAGAMAAAYDRTELALRDKTGDALGKIRRRYSQIAACDPRISRRSAAMVRALGGHLKRDPA
jgi:CelD/BcsL family acetyltransferase involved in cellulose biosynthesis